MYKCSWWLLQIETRFKLNKNGSSPKNDKGGIKQKEKVAIQLSKKKKKENEGGIPALGWAWELLDLRW